MYMLDLRQSREQDQGVAEDPVSLPSSGAVSVVSFSAVGPSPPGGTRYAGL